MDPFYAAILIAVVLNVFLMAFCAFALGKALQQRIGPEDQAFPFVNKAVIGLYTGLRLSSWIIVPTAAAWGVWMLVTWVLALSTLGAN